MTNRRQSRQVKASHNYWFERLMAAIALVNLLLVAFDLSYVPLRDFYLKQFPGFTWWYGERFKGIEPHRTTDAYLKTVDELEAQVASTGLRSPQVVALLAQLQSQSGEIIDENPFQLADKSGTLERIKNRMRDHVGVESSRQAFERFWSRESLVDAGFSQEIDFFDREIRPLIATNYYRSIRFIALFGTEFLVRTLILSRRYPGTNWFDTMLWRWYDLFLLLPFWRWLRVIPVVVRLNQSHLLNLEPIRTRISHGFITSFAVELTEIVVLQIIGQMQDIVRQGVVTRRLLQPSQGGKYVDINGVDEVQTIVSRLMSVLVCQVLPKIRPDIEALVNHSLTRILKQNPVYVGIQSVPGLTDLPTQLTQQLVAEIYNIIYDGLTTTLNDPEADRLTQHLVQNFGETLKSEVRQGKTLEELESLVADLMEEIKINYVDRLSEQDIDKQREQNHQLYGIVQGSKRQLKQHN
jgi:hypothetical protein